MNATPLELLGTEDKEPVLLRNVGEYLPVDRA
jgi:hypothetical protein